MDQGADRRGTPGTDSLPGDGAGITWVLVIYFCSGLCSLIDEVVWVRLLKLTLGNTVYASSIVVSVFMGGLALGALIMARFADRIKRRLRLYAFLELLATLSALSLPWVLQIADRAYQWFFAAYQPSAAAVTLVQVVVSAAILLVPTMVMGSTLPLLGRHVTRMEDQVGRLVGRLYALNMLGAATGCFLAGYVLIRVAGVMGSLYIAAAINLLVALSGYILSRVHDAPAEPPPEAAAAATPELAPDKRETGRRTILMAAFFASGMISIGYELIWMRSIVFLLGNFTYVFSAVLTIYLLGNVIGVWAGSRLAKRIEVPAMGFGISLGCLGILGLIYIPWLRFWNGFAELLKSSEFLGTYSPLFFCVFLFILPAAVMGVGFPLALQAWSRHLHRVGRTTGMVYGINTIGAVLGGALTGFVLIPLVGVQVSITLLGLAGIWLGAVMLYLYLPSGDRSLRVGSLAAALVLSLLATVIPANLFEQWFFGFSGYRFIAAKEGVTATVSVYEGAEGALMLATSDVIVAGDGKEIRSAQKTLGHLGILLNKRGSEILSIGFGSGETTWCLKQHEPERIDCVEIAPELVDMALLYFSHINLGEALERHVNMLCMDGKNYVHLTDRHYDVIINGADIPHHPGSAPMFAKEHFQNSLERLKPGGLFITKMHLANINETSFNSILGTFLDVFPHVTIWFPTTKPYFFFYMTGSVQEQRYSPVHIEQELEREGAKKSFEFINVQSSHDLMTWYIGDDGELREYLTSYHTNSDYTPFVEFNLHEKPMKGLSFFLRFIKKVRRNSLLNHIDWSGMSGEEQETWRQEQERYFKAATFMLEAHGESRFWHKMSLIGNGMRILPESAALREQEDEVLIKLRSALDRGLYIPDDLIKDMNTMLQGLPDYGAPWLVKSWAYQKKKEMIKASDAAERAVEYAPYSARTLDNRGMLLLRAGKVDEAVESLAEAVKRRPDDPKIRHHLGGALWRKNRFEEAIAELRTALDIWPGNALIQCDLGDMLMKQGREEEAIEHFREALKINPESRRAKTMLKRLN